MLYPVYIDQLIHDEMQKSLHLIESARFKELKMSEDNDRWFVYNIPRGMIEKPKREDLYDY